MKEKSEKINHFLLQEQFPDIIKVAGAEKRSSNSNNVSKSFSSGAGSSSVTTAPYNVTKNSVSRRIVTAEDHVTQLRLQSCRCPHLQEYLPRILNLTLCRTTPNQDHPRGWTLANPVHALHMVASQSGGEYSRVQKQRLPPTFMYGEEHHRTIALQTEGMAEYWCSFDGNSADATTTTSVQRLMSACAASKPNAKSAPIVPKESAISTSLHGSPSRKRSSSSTDASIPVAPRSIPKDSALSNLVTPATMISKAQRGIDSTQEATLATKPVTHTSARTSLPSSTADALVTSEVTSTLQFESALLPSNVTPCRTESNLLVTTSNPSAAGEIEEETSPAVKIVMETSEKSPTDKGIEETKAATATIKKPSDEPFKVSGSKSNLDSHGKMNTEIGSGDSASDNGDINKQPEINKRDKDSTEIICKN